MSADFYARPPTHAEPSVRVVAPNQHYRFPHGVASLAGATVARSVPARAREFYSLQRLGTPAKSAAADPVIANSDPGMRFYYTEDPTVMAQNVGMEGGYQGPGARRGVPPKPPVPPVKKGIAAPKAPWM